MMASDNSSLSSAEYRNANPEVKPSEASVEAKTLEQKIYSEVETKVNMIIFIDSLSFLRYEVRV